LEVIGSERLLVHLFSNRILIRDGTDSVLFNPLMDGFQLGEQFVETLDYLGVRLEGPEIDLPPMCSSLAHTF
jgi:hypothetical protein